MKAALEVLHTSYLTRYESSCCSILMYVTDSKSTVEAWYLLRLPLRTNSKEKNKGYLHFSHFALFVLGNYKRTKK